MTGAGDHIPVLLEAVLDHLRPRDGEVHVDGTFGAGGYSRAILDAADCRVIGIDRDPDAAARAARVAADYPSRFDFRPGRFSGLDAIAAMPVDGVVLDIGVSSMQIDTAERGFSFSKDGPLDMRMDRSGLSAADLINGAPEDTLTLIFKAYGEERRARAIARQIVAARTREPIATTGALAALIADAAPRRRPGDIHPATRVFQALRIAVNRELEELVDALAAAERALKSGGRLVVVTFHSLEDRIVKRFFRDAAGGVTGSRHLPEVQSIPARFTDVIRQAVRPEDAEIAENPRARSARLRSGVRTAAVPAGVSDALKALARPPGLDLEAVR